MAKMNKREFGSMGRKIVAHAKKIRDTKNISWPEAMKIAGKSFRKK
jgi:hypothetical protein